MKPCWHILGAGAIGSLFACSLQRAGMSITVLCKGDRKEQPQHRICIDKGDDRSTLFFPTSENNDTSYISHLLITTKSYDVHGALTEVAHRLDNNSHIVIMVNGMGFMEAIIAELPQLQFTLATTTHGAYRIGTGHFVHAGEGPTRLGQVQKAEPPPWFQQWSTIDLVSEWDADIEGALWQKLAINCAINPLTALHRCKNGELATRPELSTLVKQLCDEIAAVSLAAGFFNASTHIHQWAREVIAATANNRSSMLQDILAERPTEINYISGYLLKIADQYKIDTPLNTSIVQKINHLTC